MSAKNESKGKDKIEDALLKVALGYQVAEITEEYAEVDGSLKLTKRKKTKKDIPPDLKAVQLLLSTENGGYESWSDEDLEEERKRLLTALQEEQEKTKSGGRVAVKKKTTKKTKAETKKKTVKK